MLATLSFACMTGMGQETNPQRGFQPGNSYSLSDFETINNTNGNVMLNFPLGQLAAGRGGLTGGISLRYNTKLYDTDVADMVDSTGQISAQTHLIPNQKAGWDFVNPLSYRLEFISRLNVEGGGQCALGLEAKKLVYIWKVRVVYPDGAEREFRPAGHGDIAGDGYFNVNPHTGEKRDVVVSCIGTIDGVPVCSCNQGSVGFAPNPLTYFSTDGTYTRLVITRGVGWTLSFPDGSRVVSNHGGGHNTIADFFYDRNGNYLTRGNVTLPTGEVVGGLVDQFGRYVATKTNSEARETYIYSLGFNNRSLKWTVKWKTIFVLRNYRTTAVSSGRGRGNTSDQTYQGTFDVVDRITLPAQLGNLSYVFSYNAPDYVDGTPEPTTPSVGWGEVSGITMPSGAQVSYEYSQDSTTRPSVRFVLDNHLRRKNLTYQAQYDGELTPVTETWRYSVGRTGSSIVGPDGGVTTFSFKDTTLGTATAGQVFKETYPSGEVLERDWQANRAPTSVASTGFNAEPVSMNFLVKNEYRSIPDATGNLAWTSIKAFNYDKNGNVTRVAEYDWVPHSSYVAAGGIPAGITPLRVKVITYANATPDSSDGTTDIVGAYWTGTGAPTLRGAVATTEIQSGTGQKLTRAEFTYDNPLTTGNLTQQKSWDSTKGAYSNPLAPSNSISVSTQYNQYGSPTLITNARQVQTEMIYGAVGTASDLYPTEIRTALGTPVQRTEKRNYDFSTGLVIKITDVDNNVSSSTEYDDIGRPTLVRAAEDKSEETQTSTQYFDSERRVVVRADLGQKGDGKLVSIRHYDQLGRLRLTRQLEEFSTAGLTDETIGIKVQTRYLVHNPCPVPATAQCLADNDATIGTYVLTSNPYRSPTSSAASSESTMGWTRSRNDRRGLPAETQTFSSGTNLPAPWGTNSNSTGVVTTSYDAMFSTATDQAGKIRRSKTDALGRLVRVDEPIRQPDAPDNLGSPDLPTQATSYQYDALGNLTLITQGNQVRTFKYTSLSRLSEAINPESGTVTYEYDENGNLKAKTDPRLLPNSSTHIRSDYDYDVLNRQISRTHNDGTPNVTYEYDDDDVANSRGRLTKISSSVSSYLYRDYDALGRVKTGKQTTDGQSYEIVYEYNSAGTLISRKYPSGRIIKTEYDSAGRIAGVRNNAGTYYAGAASTDAPNRMRYSAAGALEAMKLGNELWEHTSFNSRLQPTQIGLGTTSSNSTIMQLDYAYGTTNNNGNLRSQQITAPGGTITQTYTYDELNRLKSASELSGSNPSWKQTYSYDRFGNRSFDASNSNTTLPGITEQNKDTTNPSIAENKNQISSVGYAYDPAGNLLCDPQHPCVSGTAYYEYTAENLIKTAGGGAGSGGTSYFYDGDGRRVKKIRGGAAATTTVFVYDVAGQLIAEYSDAPSQPGNGTSYMTADYLASPRVITTQSAQVKGRHDYLPFGEEVESTMGGRDNIVGYAASDNLSQKFTGKERDSETDLDYFGARYYRSSHGRFTTVDPYNVNLERQYASDSKEANAILLRYLGNPQHWNQYAYVLNNPLKYSDPDGLAEKLTVNMNIVYDKTELTEEEARKMMADQIADLQKVYGELDIEFNVTFTAGYSFFKDSIDEGAKEGSINVYVSKDKGTNNDGVTKGHGDIFITFGRTQGLNPIGKGVLSHEVGHRLGMAAVTGIRLLLVAGPDLGNIYSDFHIDTSNAKLRRGGAKEGVNWVDDYRTMPARDITIPAYGMPGASVKFKERYQPTTFDIYRVGARKLAGK